MQNLPMNDWLSQGAVLASIRIGQLLIEQGILAHRLNGVDFRAVEDAWAKEYIRHAGLIDLCQQNMDPGCLRLLNCRQAWQFHLLPLHRQAGNLHLATDSADLLRAAKFAVRKFNESICVEMAEPEQLREFLMCHYPVPQSIAQYADML